MKRERLLELAGIVIEEGLNEERLQTAIDTLHHLVTDERRGVHGNADRTEGIMRKVRKDLIEVLADMKGGVTENVEHAVSDTVSQLADMFVKAIEATGIDQGDADDWRDANSELMHALHEELKSRGHLG